MDETGVVRQNQDNKRTAVRMDPSVTAGEYFILDTKNGGHYGDGVREGVQEWPIMVPRSS